MEELIKFRALLKGYPHFSCVVAFKDVKLMARLLEQNDDVIAWNLDLDYHELSTYWESLSPKYTKVFTKELYTRAG